MRGCARRPSQYAAARIREKSEEGMLEKKIVLTRQQIADRGQELGKAITRDYAGRQLLVIGILNGAFVFMADLVRAIDLPLEVDFVRVASYGQEACSSGSLRFTKDVELPVAGRDVLIVEDIIDTGRTIAALLKTFERRKPRSLRVCALIDKSERRDVEAQADYVGFAIAEGFLVGYGLDYAEKYRNYPDVYHLLLP